MPCAGDINPTILEKAQNSKYSIYLGVTMSQPKSWGCDGTYRASVFMSKSIPQNQKKIKNHY